MHEPLLILSNGRFWTADPSRPWAQALAVRGSQIVALGTEREVFASFPSAERLDLGQRLCLPGLWDAHIHFYFWSLGLQQLQLSHCSSAADMLRSIQDSQSASSASGWMLGRGWNESRWDSPLLPTRQQLDEVTAPHRPAVFFRTDWHSALANTEALRLCGLLEPGREVSGGIVERDSQGLANGLLRESAVSVLQEHIPPPSSPHLDQAFREGFSKLHRYGITGICDQRMKDGEDGPRVLASLARLRSRKELKLRANVNVAAHHLPHLEGLGLGPELLDHYLRLGHLKVFSDGTLGSRTASMLEPLQNPQGGLSEETGLMLTPPEQIAEELHRGLQLGFPLSVHAIGDRANRLCLDILERSDRNLASPRVPHRIEHAQLLASEELPRFAELGVTASMQPTHLLDDLEIAEAYLGSRAERAFRLRSLWESGALLAFGSDAPIAEVNPFLGIHAAVTRQRPKQMQREPWFPSERLPLEETLKAYTLNAARAAGWEHLTGSLEIGKKADLCVLDRDLFQLVESGIRGDELAETRVLLTMFDGQIVCRAEEMTAP